MVAQVSPSSPGVAPLVGSYRPFGPVRTDRFKRLCDVVFGLGFAGVALPTVALLWALVRLTSAGPGFYSQVRVGRGGCRYRIYKLRTMRQNCEAQSGAQWAKKGDPRVTRLGGVLRKLHLDELPQLWNVLNGDMSLVGPRPERPEFVDPLAAEVQGYLERHRVRPGVTGLAQIQLPADSDIESVRTKLVLDRHYIERANFWLDVRIMLGTAVYLAGFSYARVRRLMRLPNPLTAPSKAPAIKGPLVIAVERERGARADAAPSRGPAHASETRLGSALTAADDTATMPALPAQPGPVPCGESP